MHTADLRSPWNTRPVAGVSSVANGALQTTGGTMSGALNMGGNGITGVRNASLTTTSTDAVTGQQLNATNQAAAGTAATVATHTTEIGSLQTGLAATNTTVAAVSTVANGALQTTGGTMSGSLNMGGHTVTGVGNGAVTATSHEAVNGSQLNSTNQTVAALNQAVTSGTVGVVQQAGGNPNGDIRLGATTGGTQVNVMGTSGPRVVTGIASGQISATSMDAVTGAQLFDTNQQLASQGADVSVLKSQMNSAFREIDHVRGGVAIALAASGFTLEPGKIAGLGVNFGFYDGKQAIGVQGAFRLDRTWTINGGMGWSLDGGKPGGRVGLSAQW
jgi:hypothetical protein